MSIFLPAQDAETSRRRQWRAFAIAAVVLVIGCSLKPATRGFRWLHGRKLLAEGEAYLAQNRAAEAAACGRAALKIQAGSNAGQLRASRLLLKALGSIGDQQAIYFWSSVARDPGATLEDRRELLKWAMQWGYLDLAGEQWRLLQREEPLSVESLRLGAALCELNGAPAEAALFAQAVLEKAPEDNETRVLLGRVLVSEGSARDAAIGKRLLLEQARREDRTGLQVLRFLSSRRVLNASEAVDCIGFLEKHPLREPSDLLTQAALEAQVSPYKRNAILIAAAKQFSADQAGRKEAVQWLARVHAGTLIPELIAREQAVTSREILMPYLDALGELGRWKEVDEVLDDGSIPLEPLERALFQARTAAELKESRVVDLRWEQCLEIAGKNTTMLLKVADYARRNGASAPAEKACRRLIERGEDYARLGYKELLKSFERDTARAQAVLAEMSRKYPDDRAVRNDLAYTTLLLGGDARAALELGEKLVASDSNYLSFRTTLALAELKSGAPARARAAFDGVNVVWTALPPYQKAVYAAACAETGDEEKAREICRTIPVKSLKVEERRLIARWE